MVVNSWSIDLKGFEALEERMSKYANQSEFIINSTLTEQSSATLLKNMEIGIPVSQKTGQGVRHAKGSNPYKITPINLGLRIRPKTAFEYLKYPDLGIGTSKNNEPDEFMEKGLEQSVPAIQNQLIDAFDKL